MKNYKLIVRYDGTNYSGWQIQKNAVTVQGEIRKAISIILKEDVNLIGAGRTDAGVHAWGQTANFRCEKLLELHKFKYSLNSLLPKDIAVHQISEVSENFHSRYDAVLRSYLYLFSFEKSPFYGRFSYLKKSLLQFDFNRLNLISGFLLGEKDFSSFAKNKTETENKICNLKTFRWKRKNNLAFVFVEADRFLHGMVRALIGTVLRAYQEENPREYLENILKEKNREAAAQAVPSKGLFLFKVKYPKYSI